MESDAYLGLGSNRGDREGFLRAAVDRLRALPQTVRLTESPIYETPPMGPQDQGRYLNMAVHLVTTCPAEALLEQLQQVERDLGREAPDTRRHWGPRKIDLDLLFYGDHCIDSPELTLPHPEIAERWFVLKPLSDLARELVHPRLAKSVNTLLAELESAGVPQGVAL